MLLTLSLALLRVASVLSECADNYATCTDSPCCKSEGFGCFRRPDKPYAQCRPMPAAPAVCTDDSSWLCPGWELCGDRFDDCIMTRCCQSSKDRCYSKSDAYAQCLEVDSCIDKVGKDGVHWQCNELSPAQQCSQSWKECGSSRCCVTDGFHCYKHHDRYAQCMDKCEPTTGILCEDHDKGLSTGLSALAAPPTICSDAMDECTHSRCCAKTDFSCYKKGDHFAQCLRTGSCATRTGWEGASCEELSHESECGMSPGTECTYSACCGGGLTCHMRDWGLARCMHGCSAEGNPGWSCDVRDKNSLQPPPPPPPAYLATRNFRCSGFLERHSIKRRPCAELAVGECGQSYMVVDGVYTPCSRMTNGDCAIGDPLKCDCEIKGKDCPVAHADVGGAGEGFGGEAEEESVGVVELAVVTISVILVVLGCFAGVWMCCLRQTDGGEMDDGTELEEATENKKRGGMRPTKKLSEEDYDEADYVE